MTTRTDGIHFLG